MCSIRRSLPQRAADGDGSDSACRAGDPETLLTALLTALPASGATSTPDPSTPASKDAGDHGACGVTVPGFATLSTSSTGADGDPDSDDSVGRGASLNLLDPANPNLA